MTIIVLFFLRIFGINIYEIENLEETDEAIKELIGKKYDTIIVSSEVAAFSQDIIQKYSKSQNVNIIITPSKFYKM